MSAEILEAPLRLSCVFSRGDAVEFPIDSRGNPVLARELLTGLSDLIHPHGNLDHQGTVGHYIRDCERLLLSLSALGHTGGVGRLSRGKLAQVWWGWAEHRPEANTRRVLRALDEVKAGFAPSVRDLVAGRQFTLSRESTPLAPYTENEWALLRRACQVTIRQTFADHQRMLAAAETGADPLAHGWSANNLAWWLVKHGPATMTMLGRHARLRQSTISPSALRRGLKVDAALVQATNQALFPATDVAIAYRLLFGIYTGIVPDGIDGLRLSDLDWPGHAAIIVDYFKARTSAESLTLNRRAVRLVEQWLRHSALSRRFAAADQRDALWLRRHNRAAGGFSGERILSVSMEWWVSRRDLRGDDGELLSIHRHRLRTTFETLRDKRSWFGSPRAIIDPNHSPQVEGDHYLSVATPAQRDAVEAIIAGAQADLLHRVRTPRVVGLSRLADVAAGFQDAVHDLSLSDETVLALANGESDSFTAACVDPVAGLHGPAGQPCPARPWVCLLCPLAVFAPRHAPNLLRLKAFFARQWRQMPTTQFSTVFGPYLHRVEEVIGELGRIDPAGIAAAVHMVAGNDQEIPLRPEEHTQ